MFHLHKMSRIDKYIETESRIVVARAWRQEDRERSLMCTMLLFLDDENILKLNSGDGCTTLKY